MSAMRIRLSTSQKLDALAERYPDYSIVIRWRPEESVVTPTWWLTIHAEDTVGAEVHTEGQTVAEAVSRAYRVVFPKIYWPHR